MTVIDCHVHGCTGVAMRAFRAWLDETGSTDEGPRHLWASPAFEDPRLQVEALDDAGIDAAVLTHSSQTPAALHAAAVGAGRTGPEMIALANAELARWVELSHGRLRPTAWIDPRMLESALEEIDRAARTPGVAGASVLCAYPAAGGALRFLDDPGFEPALALAEQLDLPLFVHSSARYPLDAAGLPGPAAAFVTGGMAMLVESTLCVLRLITSGTLERHPGLKLVVGQLGGVFPFLLGRLELIHTLLGADALARPRDHVDHLYVDTHSMDAAAIGCAIETLGADRIVFGSDFPVTPPALGRTAGRETVEGLQPADAILGGNAAALGLGRLEGGDRVITHVALYRLGDTDLDGFAEALATATRRSGLARNFDIGAHVPLPADEPVQHAVYSLAASWDFADLDALDEFSRHPAMSEWVGEWVRDRDVELAFVNYERVHA